MTQNVLSTTSSEHFSRAAAALKAAERDAHAAIDSAVDGLSSAYSDTKPAVARWGARARDYAMDGYDSARQAASDLRDRSQRAVDTTRGYVRDEPVKSLLIAAAVGATVIALVELVRLRRR